MTRILIAEDEDRIVSFLEKGLQANGYTTIAVGTGTDAIALARDEAFDLLILDLGLPGADGHEVLRQVRGRGERMPIIVLTARSGLDDTVGVLDGGADDHVAKPFRFEELLARIRLRLRWTTLARSALPFASGRGTTFSEPLPSLSAARNPTTEPSRAKRGLLPDSSCALPVRRSTMAKEELRPPPPRRPHRFRRLANGLLVVTP